MPLRFTIRDLLWLAVVVALAVGWWIDHRTLVENDRQNEKVLHEALQNLPMQDLGTIQFPEDELRFRQPPPTFVEPL